MLVRALAYNIILYFGAGVDQPPAVVVSVSRGNSGVEGMDRARCFCRPLIQ